MSSLMAEETETPGIYAETVYPAADRPALRANLRLRLEAQAKSLSVQEKIFSGSAVRERITKRLELARRLIQQTKKHLEKSDVSSLLMTRRGVNDLDIFLSYFVEEQKLKDETAALPPPEQLSIRDFGARGDGFTDDSAAFAQAAKTLHRMAGKPAVLRIPKGRYLLKQANLPVPYADLFIRGRMCSYDRKSHWNLVGLKNILIEGEGSDTEIIFGDFESAGIFLLGSERSTIRNLHLRYREKTFAQGTILENLPQAKAIRWKPDPGFLLPDDTKFQSLNRDFCCQSYTPNGKIVRVASHVFWDRQFTKNSDGSYTLPIVRGFSEGLKPGLKFIIPCRDNRVSGCLLSGGKFCTFEKITIFNTRAGAFTCAFSLATDFLDCRIVPAPGAVFSANADGIHSDTNYFGSYIRNCVFQNLGDDAFNTYARGYYVARCNADGLLTYLTHRQGNLLSIVDTTTGQIKAEFQVTGNARADWEGHKLPLAKFSVPVPTNVISYESLKIKEHTESALRAMNHGVKRLNDLPDLAFDFSRSGMGTVLTGNRFSGNRNNGIVIQAPSCLLENNSLDNLTSNAIRIGAFTTWNEGPPPYNITIRDNKIQDADCGIMTDYTVKHFRRSPVRAIRNLFIAGNHFSDCQIAFFLENSDGVFLANNSWTDCGKAIIRNSENIMGRQNTAGGTPLSPQNYSCIQSSSVRFHDKD